MEAMKLGRFISWLMGDGDVLWMISWIPAMVSSRCQIERTILATSSVSREERLMMVKRKSGQLGLVGKTRKAMSAETQTFCFMREMYCSLVRLCIRKARGVRRRALMILSVGPGAETPARLELVISATAARRRILMLLCLSC